VLSSEELKSRQKLAKKKYYASEKGKAAKRREDEAYKASGKRAVVEARRTANLSLARRAARKRWADKNKWWHAENRAHRRALARYPVLAADKAEIEGMYLFCSIFPNFEVDHIIPIKNPTVCGLHVLPNLRVISRTENRRKHNKFDESALLLITN
jgi:5-methylcytosine-specific restriction endonuclease McrA